MNPTDKPVVEFEERPANSPEAIKEWFYPGDSYGLQFVYPHDRAVQLAKRHKQNVLSMRNEMTKNMADPAKNADAPGVQQLEKTEVTGVNSSGEPVDMLVIIMPKPDR